MDRKTLQRKLTDFLLTSYTETGPYTLKLKDLLKEYTTFSAADSAEKEFKLLIAMQYCLTQYKRTGLPRARLSKDTTTVLKERVQALLGDISKRTHSISMLAPKELHFVWIGAIAQVQIDYMKVWVYYNTDYKISLWYDPNALLSKELFNRMVLHANALLSFEERPPQSFNLILSGPKTVKEIIRFQNQFYTEYVCDQKWANKVFDEHVIDFLVDKQWGTRDELEGIRKANEQSFKQAIEQLKQVQSQRIKHQGDKEPIAAIQLREINENLFFNADSTKDYYRYYLKELGLRQNLAAASDKARYQVLYKEGGVYLDVDLLPLLNPEVLGSMHFEDQPSTSRQPATDSQATKALLQSVLLNKDDVHERIGSIVEHALDQRPKSSSGEEAKSVMSVSNIALALRLVIAETVLDVLSIKGVLDQEERNKVKKVYQDGGVLSNVERLSHQIGFVGIAEQIRKGIVAFVEDPSKGLSQLLLGLEELRVPPKTGLSFHMDLDKNKLNNACILAHQGSLGMQEILGQVYLNDKQIVAANIDQLRGALDLRRKSAEAERAVHRFSNYRYDGLMDGEITTVYLSGPLAVRQWMDDFLRQHVVEEYTLLSKSDYLLLPDGHEQRLGLFRMLYFHTHRLRLHSYTGEGSKSSWIGSALIDREKTRLYEIPSRYTSQLIIQMGDSPSEEAAAQYLYRKRKGNSVWVQLIKGKASTEDRVIMKGCPPQLKLEDNGRSKRSRISLVGKGSQRDDGRKLLGALSGSEAGASILQILNDTQLASIVTTSIKERVTRIGLVGCALEKPLMDHSESRKEGFTYDLLMELKKRKYHVEAVSVRDALVGVDLMGRKWLGEIKSDSDKIAWQVSKESHKLIGRLSDTSDAVHFEKVSLYKDVLTPIYPEVDINTHGRFGILDRYRLPRGHDQLSIAKLKMDKDVVSLLLSSEKSIITTADIVAILAGMSQERSYDDREQRIVVVDAIPEKLEGIRAALRKAMFLSAESWWHWLAQQWPAAFKAVQDAITKHHEAAGDAAGGIENYTRNACEALQRAVRADAFDFFYLDLAQPKAYYPIINYLGNRYKDIQLINLGQYEACLSELIIQEALPIDASEYDRLLNNFKENIVALMNRDTELIRCDSNGKLRRYDAKGKPHDMIKVLVYWKPTEGGSPEHLPCFSPFQPQKASLVCSYLDTYTLFSSLKKELVHLGTANNLGAHAVPLFDGIRYNLEKNHYELPFLDLPTEKINTVFSAEDVFMRTKHFMQGQVAELLEDYTYTQGSFCDRSSLDVESVDGLNAAFIIQALLSWSKADFSAKAPERPAEDGLNTALQLHFYLNMAMMGQGVLADTTKLGEVVVTLVADRSQLAASTKALGSLCVCGGGEYLPRISKGLGALGVGLNAALVGVDVYELVTAPNRDMRTQAAVQLGFDSAGLLLNAGAIVAGLVGANTLSAFLGGIGVPFTGLTIGGMALYQGTAESAERTKACGLFLNLLEEGFLKGYTLNNQGTVLLPPWVPITRIELGKESKVHFGTIRYARYRHPFAGFSGLHEEDKVHRWGSFRKGWGHPAVMDLSQQAIIKVQHTICLPFMPEMDYNFDYGFQMGSKHKHAPDYPEYYAGRKLEERDKEFFFTHYSWGEFAMTRIHFVSVKPTMVTVIISAGNWNIIFPSLETQSHADGVHKESALVQERIQQIRYKIASYYEIGPQVLVLPSVKFPLLLELASDTEGLTWIIHAQALGVIDPPVWKDSKLQVGKHSINTQLRVGQKIIVKYHSKLPIVSTQEITSEESKESSWEVAGEASNVIQIQQEITDHLTSPHEPYIRVMNFKEDDYEGNAYYDVANNRFLYAKGIDKDVANQVNFLTVYQQYACFFAPVGGDLSEQWLQQGIFWVTDAQTHQVNLRHQPFFKPPAQGGLHLKVHVFSVLGHAFLEEQYTTSDDEQINIRYRIVLEGQPQLLLQALVLPEPYYQNLKSMLTIRGIGKAFNLGRTRLKREEQVDDLKVSFDRIAIDELVQFRLVGSTQVKWYIKDQHRFIDGQEIDGESLTLLWSVQDAKGVLITYWAQPVLHNGAPLFKIWSITDPESNLSVKTSLDLFAKIATPIDGALHIVTNDGLVYILDVAGALLLIGIEPVWIQKHPLNLATIDSSLLVQHTHVPVITLHGFHTLSESKESTPLNVWYDTKYSLFYLGKPGNHPRQLRYIARMGNKEAMLLDEHTQELYSVSGIDLSHLTQALTPDQLTFQGVLPQAEVLMKQVVHGQVSGTSIVIETVDSFIYEWSFSQPASAYRVYLRGTTDTGVHNMLQHHDNRLSVTYMKWLLVFQEGNNEKYILEKDPLFRLGTYGWYSWEKEQLYMVGANLDQNRCKLLGLKQDGNGVYMVANDKEVHQIDGVTSWNASSALHTSSTLMYQGYLVQRIGNMLTLIHSATTAESKMFSLPTKDIVGIKAILLGQEGPDVLTVRVADWDHITLIIYPRSKEHPTGGAYITFTEIAVAECGVQRKGDDLWIHVWEKELGLCMPNVFGASIAVSAQETINLYYIESGGVSSQVSLQQLAANYEQQVGSDWTLYGHAVYPVYTLQECLVKSSVVAKRAFPVPV